MKRFVLLLSLFALPVFAQNPYDVVIAGATGGCSWEPFTGPAAEFLPDGPTEYHTVAVAPAPGGWLYGVTWIDANEQKGVQVAELHPDGSLAPISQRVPDWDPLNLVVDRAGRTYVLAHPCRPGGGSCSPAGNDAILAFNAQGELGPIHVLGLEYAINYSTIGAMDLGADQCTVFLIQNWTLIRRFNVCTGSFLPDFATVPDDSFTLRVLPDGGLLVGGYGGIRRYTAEGTFVRTYPVNGSGAIGLIDAGTRAWVAPRCEYAWFDVNLATGHVTQTVRLREVIGPVTMVPYRAWSAALEAFHSADVPAASGTALALLGVVLAFAAFLRLR